MAVPSAKAKGRRSMAGARKAGGASAAGFLRQIGLDPRRKNRRGRRRSVFVGQEERGHAPVGLGDDPERIVAEAFARLRHVDRMR